MNRGSRHVLTTALVAVLGIGCGQSESGGRRSARQAESPEIAALKAKYAVNATKEDYCRIIFWGTTGEDGLVPIYEIGSDGKGFREVTRAEGITSPVRVSPDGRRLTFKGIAPGLRGSQIVYDKKREVFAALDCPVHGDGHKLCWYPRWFDNETIYYRSWGRIYKQSIHGGPPTPFFDHDYPGTWLDPIYVPGRKMFVCIEYNRICRIGLDGTGFECDSLPFINIHEIPPYRAGGGLRFTYAGYERNEGLGMESRRLLIDANGKVLWEILPDPEGRAGGYVVGPYGRWAYFSEYVLKLRGRFILRRMAARDGTTETVHYPGNEGFAIAGITPYTVGKSR
jgi:hypothetical protein